MARTRTQTGVIEKKGYGYETIRLGGEGISSSAGSGRRPKKGGITTGIRKTKNDGGNGKKRKRRTEIPKVQPVVGSQPKPGRPGKTDCKHWWPSVVIGEKEEKGLSAMERAEKTVMKWEKILEEHQKNLPEAMPQVEAQLLVARTERDALIRAGPTADDDNLLLNERRDATVKERINSLLRGLETSKNSEEKTNIQGAIDAYRSGQIGYSKQYTLIWAGKVVDVADTYAEFAIGRNERLDRYEKKYGPHWLWFESPLWVHPDSQAKAMRCAVVERVASPNEFGLFYINMGFWKREGLVTRMPQTGYTAGMRPDPEAKGVVPGPHDPVDCGYGGPKLVIRSLLDSGATYPSLYASDFRSLGVYPSFYPAQSLADIMTASGKVTERVYEMHVQLVDENCNSLVDPLDPVNPRYPLYLGGLSPVLVIGLDDSPPIDMDGIEDGIRLSGIMPFLAAYISSTPSKNIILLGENRNDVLGAHKIPPVRRWMVGLSQDPSDTSQWINFQDPMITFSHRKGLILEQDIGRGASKLTVNVGRGDLERSETFDPRGDYLKEIAAGQPGGVVDPSV